MTAILYSGGDVFDGTGDLLKDHAVLVEGDTITNVAPAEKFSDYQGERVDTSDGTLMPGIADCHVHLVYKGEADPRSSIEGVNPGEITLRVLENAQLSLKSGTTAEMPSRSQQGRGRP